jgi:hypothetical protein
MAATTRREKNHVTNDSLTELLCLPSLFSLAHFSDLIDANIISDHSSQLPAVVQQF